MFKIEHSSQCLCSNCQNYLDSVHHNDSEILRKDVCVQSDQDLHRIYVIL